MNNRRITTLVIDSRESICLFESIIEDRQLPVKIIPLRNFTDASTFLNLSSEVPDVLLIGSGVILREGSNKLLHIIHSEKFSLLKTYVLTEFPNEERHLYGAERLQARFIPMPSGYEEMAAVVIGIFEDFLSYVGKINNG